MIRGRNGPMLSSTKATPTEKIPRASAVSRVVGSVDHFCPYAPTFSEGVTHSVSPNKI